MKNVVESTRAINLKPMKNHISIIDIPDYRSSLRAMMDNHFLHCSRTGIDPDPAYCAYKVVDAMLENIQVESQVPAEPLKAVGM